MTLPWSIPPLNKWGQRVGALLYCHQVCSCEGESGDRKEKEVLNCRTKGIGNILMKLATFHYEIHLFLQNNFRSFYANVLNKN